MLALALLLPLALSSPSTIAVGGQEPAARWGPDVEAALALAGSNRAEIEAVLAHYGAGDDLEKLEAARFLIANMPGHGSLDYALTDAEGRPVPFDALEHGSYQAALAAMDALEAEHGPLEFTPTELIEDLHVLTAEDLIRGIDLAFEAWRGNPWSQGLDFETFCEHVLPHRGSNEPAEDWRGVLMGELPELLAELGPEPTLPEVASRMQRVASQRVGFNEVYYLHPTDQGFSEMGRARRGRCEDITNMTSFCLRAAAVASAADYTPWWAHRDNNHAWPVILDAEGRGRSGDGNRAAKVWRKVYSTQRDSLPFAAGPDASLPKYLDRPTQIDVTDQYFETHDVTVALPTTDARVAYLCVFNGGEWRPIHWARVDGGRATFDRMHGGLLYLPAFFVDGGVVPAAEPFCLTADGEPQPFLASSALTVNVELPAGGATPRELFVWRDGDWRSLGTLPGDDDPVVRTLPAGGLFWLVAEGGRRLERPFGVEGGARRGY